MEATKESVEEFLKTKYTEDGVIESVDEVMSDYLSDGWEEEYDDAYEAYIETGNGEAESHVCTEIYNEILKDLNMTHEQYAEAVGEEVWDTVKEVYECLDK